LPAISTPDESAPLCTLTVWEGGSVSHITYSVLEGTLNIAQSNPIRVVSQH